MEGQLRPLKYKEALIKAMEMLAYDKRTVFIGQNIIYPGAADLLDTIREVPSFKRLEVPVFEDTQMGLCIGLSLIGYVPVCIFPRMDFLICALNQLVNHLDKIEDMSKSQFTPKVIIRTCIGSKLPLNPGEQHCQDYSEGLEKLVKNIRIRRLQIATNIIREYAEALDADRSTVLIEYGEKVRYD